MTNLDTEVILVRLRLIAKYRNALEEFRSISLNEYLADFRQQLIVERLLQLMVEAATDINKYILVRRYQISTVKYTEAFIEAGRQGIITAELASELAQAAGMKNILVHQYKDIDSTIVFATLPKALIQY
ncbi:MAG: DUF86 domain-containing protein [Coleofasciculus sp. C1-SOL-03]|uniref:type VII toxin-antitoxin system HepT family RNase toxin n=1 Tax=Coleofasciculus sp. C1-SOL-03 TaxID=3069522 RepID=UPI0032FB5D7B